MEKGRFTLPAWGEAEAAALCGALHEMAEEDYRVFQSRLIPTRLPILGVRLPALRALAAEIGRGDWRGFLALPVMDFYEGVLLRGLVIGRGRGELPEILAYVREFVPLIDNWGVNDSFVPSLKITKSHPAEVWDFLRPYLRSEKEFELRFWVVMCMDYFLTEAYIDRVLEGLSGIRHEGYYVKMAVAWALSVCFVKFREKTLPLLTQGRLDGFTHNKTIQKCVESYRVSSEDKAMLRTLRVNTKESQDEPV